MNIIENEIRKLPEDEC